MQQNRTAKSNISLYMTIIVLLVALVIPIFLQIQIARLKRDQQQAVKCAEPILIYDVARDGAVEVLVDGYLAGSGWFVDLSGLVMTADHVIGSPGKKIEVISHSVGRVEAEVIAVDRAHDLALLRLPASSEPYPSLPSAMEVPIAGTAGYCYGAPMFRHDVMMTGFVGRNDTTFEWFGDQQRYVELVHFSAQSPKGFSGGLWMDGQGRVIGLQSGAMVSGSSQVGIAFVIPVEAINALVSRQACAKTPTLGIACEEMWEQPVELRNRLPKDTRGVVVKFIAPQGPAEIAKLQMDDIIIKADSKPIQYRDELLSLVRSKNVGDKIVLTILKPDSHEPAEVEITLGCLEKEWIDHLAKNKNL